MNAHTVILIVILVVAFLFLSAMRIWNRFAVGFETKTRGEIELERQLARRRGQSPPPRPDPTARHPGATVLRRDLTAVRRPPAGDDGDRGGATPAAG